MAWNDLTLSDKARMIQLAVNSGITDLRTIQEVYNKYAEGGPKRKLIDRINSTSNANFVSRLKDPNRQYVTNPDGTISTHRLAYVTTDDGAIVYPEVQEIDGNLVSLEGDEALESAIARRDTLQMSAPEAEWFTKNYKKYYPQGHTFETGGPEEKTYYTAKWKKLPKSYQKGIIQKAKEMNIPESEVPAWYESGRLNAALGPNGYPNNGRARENDSPTKEASEALENSMNRMVYDGASSRRPNMKYAIPYLEDREIKVKGVGRVTTNALDSLAKYAAIVGVPLEEALGLSAQETAFGAAPYYNYDSKINGETISSRALGNSSYFRNFGVIPAENLVRDFRYNKPDWKGEYISQDVPPLQHALEYWKAGKYNPGDPNHTSDVRNKGKKVMSDPNIQQWMKDSQYVKKKK